MIEYRDTWPILSGALWRSRHAPAGMLGFTSNTRACPSCSGFYTLGHYWAHLRSEAHARNRGWWRA